MRRFDQIENLLAKLLPEYGDLSDVIRVIDVPTVTPVKS